VFFVVFNPIIQITSKHGKADSFTMFGADTDVYDNVLDQDKASMTAFVDGT
jgi:hypothetical protein